MKNLSLNFFTSTHQHYGCTDIYKYTLSDLFKKSKIITDCYKISHIKILPGEEGKGNEIESILKNDFKFDVVLKTVAFWKNDDNSHHIEYLKDIKTLYSYPELQNIKYGLFMENDWIFHKENLDPYISDSISILEYSPELLTFRYTRIDDSNIIERTQAKLLEGSQDIYVNSMEFSFNPTFVRNRDIYYISRFTAKNYMKIHPHCELAFTYAANYLNSDNYEFGFYGDRFSFIDSKIVEHIGFPEAIRRLKL